MEPDEPSDVDPYGKTRYESVDPDQTVDLVWDSVFESPDQDSRMRVTIGDYALEEGVGNFTPPSRKVSPASKPDRDADYYDIGPLGEGGMAIVTEAMQVGLNRTVAMKSIRARFAKHDSYRARFFLEATTVAALEHPNIIPIHDIGVDREGRPFYAMKRVVGTPWRETLPGFTLEKNLRVLLDVADAVAFAHSRGVVHRDLKPDNILVGDFGEVTVIDWGLAVAWQKGAPAPSADVAPNAGTPGYMAPEMALGLVKAVGPRTDVYLLGAILHEILTGSPPHHGQTLRETLRSAAANRLWVEAPDGELGDIARRAMATVVEDRYSDVKEFQTALRRWFGHAESERMLERAVEFAEEARKTHSYDTFSRAMFAFEEALRIWPENMRAADGLERTRQDYARLAAERGDLDLALSLLDVTKAEHRDLVGLIEELRLDRRLLAGEAEELRLGVEKWSKAFFVSPDAVAIFRMADRAVIEVNGQFEQMLGWRRDEALGCPLNLLGWAARPVEWDRFLERLAEDGNVKNVETHFRSRDGRLLPVLLSAQRFVMEDGEVGVANARDISALKQAERARRRLESRLREVLRQVRVGTWELDPVTSRFSLGRESHKILGLTAPHTISTDQDFLRHVDPADRATLDAAWRRASRQAETFEVVIRIIDAETGNRRRFRMAGKPMQEEGRVVEILGSLIELD